jgi:predicted nucleic acid-binding protein
VTLLTGVLDANVVIGLAKGGVFDRLVSVYAPLYIPAAVRDEVIQQGQGRDGVLELSQAIGRWVTVVDPDPQDVQGFAFPRSVGDRQVLAVARAHAVDHVLTSDGPLRREATRFGFTCLGATDVVVLLKHQGLLTRSETRVGPDAATGIWDRHRIVRTGPPGGGRVAAIMIHNEACQPSHPVCPHRPRPGFRDSRRHCGDLALVSAPGELFVELGLEIKRRSLFGQTMVLELANDSAGYLPARRAYEEGAYEPEASLFAPGVGEQIVRTAVGLLSGLRG